MKVEIGEVRGPMQGVDALKDEARGGAVEDLTRYPSGIHRIGHFGIELFVAVVVDATVAEEQCRVIGECEELAGAEINIHALSISDTADHSVVRMAVSDPTKALMLLGERGVLALETEVLMIETENHPGVLGQIAHRLADAEVNIEYAYMAATLNSTKGLMILRPDDVEKAQQVLHDL